jgi:heptosyltransferase I
MMSAIGDAVQVLPVIHALKRAWPSVRIHWLIQPVPHSLVAGHRAVDRFILYPRGDRRRTPRALWRAWRELRRVGKEVRETGRRQPGGAFDFVLDLQVYLKAGLLTAMAPGRVKVGFDRRRARDLNRIFTTHPIPPAPGGYRHTQDQYFEFLRFLGVDPEPLEYGLEVTLEERSRQHAFFKALERPAVGVVLATSDPRKDWFPDRYARVMDALFFDFGLQPVMVGGWSRRERRVAAAVERLARAPLLNAMAQDLRRLLWLLDGCLFAICPDTGPLHMARAMEVPVIGLYGNTNPRRSGPYRRFQELVVDGYARYPGEDYGISPRRRRNGMRRVSVGMVLEKVDLALREYG